MKVLIAEDNALIALSLEALVADLGYNCASPAASADEAIEVARAERPACAIVDLNLADGWSGPRLVGSLSAMGIRSVIVSGQIEEFDAPGHVLGVLPKPVDEQALAALLQCAAADRQRDSGQD